MNLENNNNSNNFFGNYSNLELNIVVYSIENQIKDLEAKVKALKLYKIDLNSKLQLQTEVMEVELLRKLKLKSIVK